MTNLHDLIDALRRMLAPPSAVILTGAEVAEHFKRLREGGAFMYGG